MKREAILDGFGESRRSSLVSFSAGLLIFGLAATTPSSAAQSSEICVAPICAPDVICNFNNGNFCGQPVGDAQFCAGFCSTGLCSSGNGRVVVGDSDFFSQTDFEVEARVTFSRLPGPGEFGSAIASKYMGNFPHLSEWILFVSGNGTREWGWCGDGVTCTFSPVGSVQENVAYHVRGVLRGNLGEIWVNGQLVASGSVTRNSANTSTPVVIAGTAGGDSFAPFFGMVDEIRIGCINTNRPPIAACNDIAVTADPSDCRASASVDAGSFDPDGDAITLAQSPEAPYGLGSTAVTLTATDPAGLSDSCTATVTVTDATPPEIAGTSASPNRLWPPNHQMVAVTVRASVVDACDPDVSCRILAVTSNEPIDGLGDGDTAPDWVVTGDLAVDLRAERSGRGSGRVYTITLECNDAAGNTSAKSVAVMVPKSQAR